MWTMFKKSILPGKYATHDIITYFIIFPRYVYYVRTLLNHIILLIITLCYDNIIIAYRKRNVI